MFRITSRARQSVVLGAIAGLSLTLGACSGDSSSGSSTNESAPKASSTATPTTTSTPDSGVAASGDFCSLAIDSVAASKDFTTASGGLDTAMSDPSNFTNGDMTSIHDFSQSILDSANVSARFYASGASNADDPNVKAAFRGLSDFTNQYTAPLAQAGLDANTMIEYATATTTMLTDPNVMALLTNAADWSVTVADYTQQQCNVTLSAHS